MYSASSAAQVIHDSTGYYFVDAVDIDSLIVQSTALDIPSFMQRMQQDESFYYAFRNLRFVAYKATHELWFYRKRTQKQKAHYYATTKQEVSPKDTLICRRMHWDTAAHSGNFYKRKKTYRYFTAELYDRLFFTHGEICANPHSPPSSPNGLKARYVQSLKKLLFSPGQRIQVPFIAARTELFSPRMQKFYTYSLQKAVYQGDTCYVFEVETKPEYQTQQTGKTVVKYLRTYFNRENLQVLGRNYALRFEGIPFSFDIEMEIRLQPLAAGYVPAYIRMEGWWRAGLGKPELSKFESYLSDFEVAADYIYVPKE